MAPSRRDLRAGSDVSQRTCRRAEPSALDPNRQKRERRCVPSGAAPSSALPTVRYERRVVSNLVTIAVYTHVVEAQIARSLLVAHEVEAFVPDEHLATLNPHVLGASGGVRLQVGTLDAERALAILGDVDGEDQDEQDDEAHQDGPACPRCGARYAYFEIGPLARVLDALLFGFPLRFLRKEWHCRKCDHFFQHRASPAHGGPYRSARPGAHK
jgi:hypothetical protein